jgi:hypothetical protein
MADGDTVAWVANVGATVGSCGGRFNCTANVLTSSERGISSVVVGDIDSDGDVDVVLAAAGDGRVSWLPNSGNGTFPLSATTIFTACPDASSAALNDVDGDGDVDVIVACPGLSSVLWFQNRLTEAGAPVTSAAQFDGTPWNVSSSCGAVTHVALHDIDDDGFADVIAAVSTSGTVVWLPSTGTVGDPSSLFASNAIAVSVFPSGGGVVSGFAVGDIDRDGDVDVVGGGVWAFGLMWAEAVGTSPASSLFARSATRISADHVSGFTLAAKAGDLNGDGCVDVVAVSQADGRVAAYDCPAGHGFDGTQHLLRPLSNSTWPTDLIIEDMCVRCSIVRHCSAVAFCPWLLLLIAMSMSVVGLRLLCWCMQRPGWRRRCFRHVLLFRSR